MEIEKLIMKMKEIHPLLLAFINSPINSEDEYRELINYLESHKSLQDKEQSLVLLQLISKIFNNNCQAPYFCDNFEKILRYIITDQKVPISPIEIFQTFQTNQQLLLRLFEKGILNLDGDVLNEIFTKTTNQNIQHRHYFFRVIKPLIDQEKAKEIEKEILENYDEKDIETFEEKCEIGQNDSFICSLIRSDSIEEFVSFVTRNTVPLESTIKHSPYESNSFLNGRSVNLIEYAAFFGSIQIFQYLKLNGVGLNSILWNCVVHSNNPELIHLLEENHIPPFEENFDCVLKESIQCHHNDICEYINDNLMPQRNGNKLDGSFDLCIVKSLNFTYFPSDILSIIIRPKNENGFNMSNLCLTLKKITIPASVASIGKDALSDCLGLEEIGFESGSKIKEIINNCFYNCSSLQKIEIPSSVVSIGYCSF